MKRRTRRRQRRKQRGGTRTASGANGCVFIPSLLGDETKVSKVFRSKFSFKLEVDALELIDKDIDPTHEFTVRGTPDHIDISLTMLNMCPETYFAFNNDGKYYVIHYDYAGIPLSDLTDTGHLNAFVTLFKHVCNMNLRGFIHGDIGLPNITFKDGKFYLIDYEFVERAVNNKSDIKDMLKILKRVYDIEYPKSSNNINKLDYTTFVENIKDFLDTI